YIRPDGVREVQNAGETRHRGVELGVGAQITSWLRLEAAQSWSKQTYLRWRPRPTLDYAGQEVERAPRGMTNLRARIKPSAQAAAVATLEWSRLSRYWEDAENTHMYEGHSILNLNASWPLKWGASMSVRVLNLTDARYADYASYNIAEGEQLQPGAPRTIYIGLLRNWPQ
ncbi:MAG: TonB-dependent receptor domain-containing protein, partial [Gemmatimonadota bacterium]